MAITKTARGQITIVDLNDAKQVQLILSPSNGTSQIFNTEATTWLPDYTANNNVITPKIFETGDSTNYADKTQGRLKSFEWKINGGAIDNYATENPDTHVLTINKNIPLDLDFFNIQCVAVYTDPVTKLDTTLESNVTIQKSSTAGALLGVQLIAADGVDFGTSDDDNKELTVKAQSFKGSNPLPLGSQYVGKWQALQVGGDWKDITKTSPSTDAEDPYITTANDIVTLHVRKKDVLNWQSYRFILTDTKLTPAKDDDEEIQEVITFQDRSDNYSVELFTGTGNVIKNGVGETVIMARVYQGSELIEDETKETESSRKFNYEWWKYAADGSRVNWFNEDGKTERTGASKKDGDTVNYLTGNKVTLYASEVESKCTVWVEISKK